MKPVALQAEPIESPVGKRSGSMEFDAVVCVTDGFGVDEVLHILPYRRLQVALDPAAAFEMCLQGRTAMLVIDLTPLSPGSLSALAHLRMLRPELPIVLLHAAEDPAELRGTALDGLPVFPLPRRRPRFTELRKG